jgi:phosphatidylethanolamine/phosphatidyl-N-methylethanolamine N-methyltransferase
MKNLVSITTPSKMFFLKQFLSKPFGIGSITPSGKQLAKLMVSNLQVEEGDLVVELGPGTGVFTTELLRQGVPASNIILVEFNPGFALFLRKEFPNLRIIEGDASNLPQLLKTIGIDKVKRIVSGIPMRSLKPSMRNAITQGIAESLVQNGVVVQFTYALVAPLAKIQSLQFGLSGHKVANAMQNMPPAFIWRYVKV